MVIASAIALPLSQLVRFLPSYLCACPSCVRCRNFATESSLLSRLAGALSEAGREAVGGDFLLGRWSSARPGARWLPSLPRLLARGAGGQEACGDVKRESAKGATHLASRVCVTVFMVSRVDA